MPNATVPADAGGLPFSPPPPVNELPKVYGLSVKGSCMAPDYPDGAIVVVSTTAEWKRGDVVAVWFHPHLQQLPIIKRLAIPPSFGIRKFPYRDHPESEAQAIMLLSQTDTPDKWLTVRCCDVAAVHKVLRVSRSIPIDGEEEDSQS